MLACRCRITLAVAGDSLDDANFERHTADAMILRLSIELEWIQTTIDAAASGALRAADSEPLFWDRVLEHRIREAVHAAEGRYRA